MTAGEITTVFFGGLGRLLAIQLVVSLASYGLLRLTTRAAKLRMLASFLLAMAYHVAAYRVLTQQSVLFLGVVFTFFHLGFVFRLLSSIYWHRRPGPAPDFWFHLVMLLFAPWQHYGAGRWSDLDNKRIGRPLLKRWLTGLGYSVIVVTIAGFALWWVLQQPLAVKELLIRALVFVLALEGLTFVADIQAIVWSFFGRHYSFFGNFAWIRSKHIGQFWQNWNVFAVRAFREFSEMLRLRRHYFANTMIVFIVSGFLHQVMVFYYTRQLSYGTWLSFVIHGLLVYVFSMLYRKRRRMPAPIRILLFNPVTSAVVVLLASQPFVMDFYGAFAIEF